MAEDDGEHVVEVMRDAAGQAAERLHALRLAQLLLQLFALGLIAAALFGERAAIERVEDRALERGKGELAFDEVVFGAESQCFFRGSVVVLSRDDDRGGNPRRGA